MATTYCTESHLTTAYGTKRIAQLSGDPQGSTVDSAQVQDAIDRAASRMNGHIRTVYNDLPFDETHDLLRDLNMEGAYLILKRESPNGLSDEEVQQWKDWKKQLDQISSEQIDLKSETDTEEEAVLDENFSVAVRRFGRRFIPTVPVEGADY